MKVITYSAPATSAVFLSESIGTPFVALVFTRVVEGRLVSLSFSLCRLLGTYRGAMGTSG